MTIRVALACVLALSLSACSSVNDRYAFWRDEGTPQGGVTPNLADVPAAPNVDAAKQEMEAMRARMEQDRQNAYLAAQGIVPVDPNATFSTNPNTIQQSDLPLTDELAPVGQYVAPQASVTTNYAPVAQNNTQQQPGSTIIGNVQYNYGVYSEQPYVYSHMPVRTDVAAPQAGYPSVVTDNSVSIDWSALGGAPTQLAPQGQPQAYISPVGVTGQPSIYFKHGSASLSAQDKQKLQQIADNVKGRASSVVIVGHASKRTGLNDAAASKAVNLKMSAKRVNAVMGELARQGVPADRMKVSASGDTNAQGENKDRRVDILFDQ